MSKVHITAAIAASLALATAAGCESADDVGAGGGSGGGDTDADTDADGDADTDSDTDTSPCEEGSYDCDENDDYVVCSGGEWQLVEECDAECDPTFGCVVCDPADTYCEGDIVMECKYDGSGWLAGTDCSEYGAPCVDGECDFDDPCAQAMFEKSNIGCEYWAADLDNAENIVDDAAAAQFAVAVANIGQNGTAHVEVHINNAAQGEPLDLELVEEHDIEELDLYIFLLPRRDVDGIPITLHVDDGPQTWLSSRAFRIVSDVPVVAYQFNTLDQQFSNDASLLIPTSGLGKDYLVIGYSPSGPVAMLTKNRAYVTVLGTEADTTVEVTPTYDIVNGDGVSEVSPGVGIEAGTSRSFDIGPFDVLNLETTFMTLFPPSGEPDLTGSIVTSDKPVVVFFGVDLSMVVYDTGSEDSCCAEHIEQQVIPSAAMGQNFVVSHSAQRSSGSPEPDFYRIMAYEGGTVTTSLPSPDDQFTLLAGDYREFFSTTGFSVQSSDGYLHVAQFLVVGTDCNPTFGDSSLLYVPAVDQRRGLYVFTTGQGFAHNYAVISMPENTPVLIDGWDVSAACEGPHSDGSITDGTETTDYESWTCEIPDGIHMVHSGPTPEEADVPIAVFVYGYYAAGSYAYPAGSDLRKINPVVVE